ncbi:DUF2530 domain-containing protein [Pseudonocardia sp. HH130630-07]|uniref:DUF2530 domain-containing protein n=1 Tax=Pseudonocardia sp. HH130630-07 TaxID=1690815 RepID=UPI000814F434|nr:DUF2530 domain-containing protein [Pseudonocardia sp. HH130630-07]ANY06261.1 hypothetical protein AFB00_08065 [Pseudonocardia sp. HH130630-07]
MTAPEPGDPPPPPPLPQRFYESPPVILGGMLLWALAIAILLLVWLLGGPWLSGWFWTCVAGLGVGLFGATVFTVQRAASRRGDRSAQRDVR